MSRKPAHDPLASLRLSSPSPEAPAEGEAAHAEPPVAPDALPPEPPPADAKKDEPPPVVPEPPKPAEVTRYRVTAMKQFSYKGNITTFKLGKIVSEATHGKGSIELFKACGVPMEEIDEAGNPVPAEKAPAK